MTRPRDSNAAPDAVAPDGHGPSHGDIRVPAVLALLLAVFGGIGLAVQGRLNSELGVQLQDRIGAALISFGTGFIAVLVFATVLPSARARLRRVPSLFRQRWYPPWYLLAGLIGAFYVFTQTVAVGPIGLSLFTIAVVSGQLTSGLVVDRLGLGSGRKIPVNGVRIAGAVLALAAAVTAALPHFGNSLNTGLLVLLMLLPLAAGLMQSVQQGMLGQIAMAHGSPVISTLFNFGTGTMALLAVWTIQAGLSGQAGLLTPQWWLYTGGPLGTLVLGAATLSVANTGVLLTSLGMIGGQLVGSLVLDILWPTAGSLVGGATIAGILLTSLALVIASRPWRGK